MKFSKHIKGSGIHLRSAHNATMIITLIVTALLLIEVNLSLSAFSSLSSATNDFITLQKGTDELMEASDYLTESVQCFAVTGDPKYMNDYITESEVSKRREKALQTMSEASGVDEAYEKLQKAMGRSVALMDTEYYSMKLVTEAKGISDVPRAVADIELRPEDKALSPDEKTALAIDLVHNKEYYDKINLIRADLTECTNELEAHTRKVQSDSDSNMHSKLRRIKLFIILQSTSIIAVLIVTSCLGINPILKSVDKIKDNCEIPVTGSYEFRYLAETYNKMYEAFKKSIANLNYDASHDKLTGLYNRTGYDALTAGIDLGSTAALLIDADKFKDINDTYGHKVGDQVLKKIADTLKRTFRSGDYICRIGGDEFVVYMINMEEERRELIKVKIDAINKALADTSDKIPAISLSVGVAFGKNVTTAQDLIKNADIALYQMKEQGRNGCCFYEPGKA